MKPEQKRDTASDKPLSPAERHQLMTELLQAALEREPAERRAFLAEACAGDENLRGDVESLISSYEQARSFIETPALARPGEGVGETVQDEGGAIAGQRIGHYRLIREIGHGGMGTVYLAARDDDEFSQRVAVKLVRRGMDTEFVLRRFRHERQILAALDHPNIARLLDGGTTVDGLPYFVMEYIEGEPINVYCDRERLSTVERLKLFRTVCAAVHYAHQNLIVHRDIKPGNILLTRDGTPKLLDFGIAKILNPELAPQSSRRRRPCG